MERSTIENVREYKFDPKKVIEGLNGYYCESERAIPTRCFIRVYRNDVDGPVYLGADLWLSALIEWLREDHDIFYYPGMDIRDSKNQERDTEIKNLKERIEELESDFKAVCDEDDIFRTRALKAEEELKKLKTGQKSDINKLIRDYCAKNNIIAPSRYLSDEACVKYLCVYLRSLDNRAVDVEKRAYENILFYLISYWENLGYDRHDILFGDYRNRSITLTIENLINKYAEKDRQAQSCDVELKRARDTIETLKRLINDVNTELEYY